MGYAGAEAYYAWLNGDSAEKTVGNLVARVWSAMEVIRRDAS